MAIASCSSISLLGLNGNIITVEVDIQDGIPGFILLGLPDSALTEARDRVKSALINISQSWPKRKITVALSPAWLPKSGSGFDLAIAIAILKAQAVIPAEADQGMILIGELGLDGEIRPVRGVLSALLAARSAGFTRAIISQGNSLEGSLVDEMQVLPSKNLSEVIDYLVQGILPRPKNFAAPPSADAHDFDFSDVAGQQSAKKAMEIAAIGGHHLFFVGPPGTGKTMLAQRLPTILPPLNEADCLEVTAIHSIAGAMLGVSRIFSDAPFIALHHSSTQVALVGGGTHYIKPGACSLAHKGVLFIDEAPECATGLLDALRQPLESGVVNISRAVGTVTYPANFLLILAANPCPCGRFSGKGRACTCSSLKIRRYMQRLSGPLMDRIDIRLTVLAPSRLEMASTEPGESSKTIRERVISARALQSQRFSKLPWKLNSQIPASALRLDFAGEKNAMTFLHDEMDKDRLSARGFHKVLRLAWSIADSEAAIKPTLAHVQRALEIRQSQSVFAS